MPRVERIMFRLERTKENLNFLEVLTVIKADLKKFPENKIFARRKSWNERLYWEIRLGEEICYRMCIISDNCDLDYIKPGIETDVKIDDALAKDWEVWIEVLM